MARLQYQITGDVTGLQKAATDASAILKKLQTDAAGIKIGGISSRNAIADTATQAEKALKSLDAKLSVIKGNADLFGNSLKNQTSEIAAYQGAINRLLSAGYEPANEKVIELKANIDRLTASIDAQKAASVKKTIISDSSSEISAFASGQSTVGGNVEASGTGALIKSLNADFEAGTISATEYKSAIDHIAESEAYFAQQAVKVNALTQEETGILAGLNTELKALKSQRLTIVDPTDLARQNRLIQELEADISRFGNVGKVGFDETGVAIKNFGKNTDQANSSVSGLGRGLTRGFGYLRQIAYILPGIGIAGIFNLAFEGIAKASDELGVFNTKLTLAESNLKNLNEVSSNASKQYGEQSSKLKILYQAAIDVNNSEHDRLLAVRELQKEFPDYFKNISQETILNGGASGVYQQLTKDILDNAKAKAAATKIAELSAKQLDTDFQKQKIFNALSNENARVKPIQQTNPGTGNDASLRAATFFSKQQQLQSIADQKYVNGQRAAEALREQDRQKKDLQAQIDFLTKFAGGNNKIAQALSTKNTPGTSTSINTSFEDLSKQLDEIAKKSANAADNSGLEGYALDVSKLIIFYSGLNDEIDAFVNKVKEQEQLFDKSKGKSGISQAQGNGLIKSAIGVQSAIGQNFNAGLSDLDIKEAQRVSNEIQRINDEFGVRSEQSRNKELAAIQARYDAEVVKAKGNKEILSAIDNGRLSAIQSINEKYIQLESDLWEKIDDIDQQAQETIGDKTAVETARINKEWESRRDAANKYYQQLKAIASSQLSNLPFLGGDLSKGISGLVSGGISSNQSKTNSNITDANSQAVALAKGRDLLSSLQSASNGFISDFVNGLENANQEIGYNFSTVFAGIASSFQKTMSGIAIQGITKVFERQFEEKIKGLSESFSKQLQGAIAGLAIAGSLLSGVTSKTSIVGQGLGGALSGAASGALAGTAIAGPVGTIPGAIIGGAIGLLGGIFGASKAQKELQQQQLEQQKQQTDLLQKSLAYTSQVIGRMTNQGVITNVSVGAFGQLTAKVNGKDLQFVLDRYNNGR